MEINLWKLLSNNLILLFFRMIGSGYPIGNIEKGPYDINS